MNLGPRRLKIKDPHGKPKRSPMGSSKVQTRRKFACSIGVSDPQQLPTSYGLMIAGAASNFLWSYDGLCLFFLADRSCLKASKGLPPSPKQPHSTEDQIDSRPQKMIKNKRESIRFCTRADRRRDDVHENHQSVKELVHIWLSKIWQLFVNIFSDIAGTLSFTYQK